MIEASTDRSQEDRGESVRYNRPVPDQSLDRMRDGLAVNGPYSGLVAKAYDTWIPFDEQWPEEAVYRRALEQVEGPILELGSGTGRPLLRWLQDGLPVEGLDASADMLAILKGHADELGLDPVLHHADFAPLSLDRRFGAIVCLAGSFSLIADEDRAVAALASYLDHLHDGGVLGLTLGDFVTPPEASFVWRLRRTGTDADGVSYVVHEAVHNATDEPIATVYDRIETYDRAGTLIDTTLRRHRLRRWERAGFDALLADVGFVDVRSVGDDQGWVVLAHRST
jgi:Methyltransferase domain